MKKENPVPDDIYSSVPLNRNGVAPDAMPASVPRELPVVGAPPAGPSMPYMGEVDDEGIDPRQIVGLLLRRWKIILTTFFTILLIGVLYTLLAQPVYQAESRILVSSSAAGSSAAGQLDFITQMTGGRSQKIETEIEILKSEPIKEGALNRVSQDLRESLERFSETTISPVRNTDIVAIVARSRNPLAAQQLSNAIGEEYIEQSVENSREQTKAASTYVREQLQNARKRLDTARAALRDYKEANSVVELTAQSQALIGELGGIETELRKSQADRNASRMQAEQLRSATARMAPTQESARTITRTPAIMAMQDRLTKLELQLATARQEYVEQSPEVENLKREIEAVRLRMSREAQVTVSSRVENPNPLREAMLKDLAVAQAQAWAMDARSQALETARQQTQQKLADLPEQEYQLSRLTADVLTLQQTEQLLATKYQELNIREEANVPTARVVDSANLPQSPVSPRRVRNFVLSAFLGLIIALGLAALVDRMDDRVHSDEDAEAYSRLPVIAHVPMQATAGSALLLEQDEHTSPLLESFRMLRANIAFSSLDKPLRSIAVTSSQPGEGKSTTAVNLATVMAMSGKSVVLVDADLRRPTVHRVTNVSNKVGFTSVVTGQADLDEALQTTSVSNLRVLTSGPIPPNPFELLESQTSRNCFRQIAELADFMVVDTPPVLAVADTQMVSSIVDGVLVVISCKEAGKREVARVRDLLEQTGTVLVGAVLNKVPVGGLNGYYGAYAYNYHPEYQHSDGVVGKNVRRKHSESDVPSPV